MASGGEGPCQRHRWLAQDKDPRQSGEPCQWKPRSSHDTVLAPPIDEGFGGRVVAGEAGGPSPLDATNRGCLSVDYGSLA